MKRFLAVVAGFFATSAVFISGAGVAMYLFLDEPVTELEPGEVAALWSPAAQAPDARVVPTDGDGRLLYESKMAKPDARDRSIAAAETSDPAEATDPVQVASVEPAQAAIPEPEPIRDAAREAAMPAEHLAWCNDKYRSYVPETNSFTPYGGGSKPCVSPYWDGSATASAENGGVQYAANESLLPRDHVIECMERYRSYRVSDNTYQPYGGGPREQCR